MKIIIEDYQPIWAEVFEALRQVYARQLEGLFLAIEHVGSTSVVGLAAKPVIDIDIVVEPQRFGLVAEKLAILGYHHAGDLGIEGREVFKRDSLSVPYDGSGREWMRHNLYVCMVGTTGLRNHLALRDFLRANPERAAAYGALKKALAAQNPDDISWYVEQKTPFITAILAELGFEVGALSLIRYQNRR